MNQQYDDLKHLIIDSLNLDDISADSIDVDAPLFVTGLGLDSIDALELAVAIEKKYGIKLKMDPDTKKKFYSVKTLSELIESLKQNT